MQSEPQNSPAMEEIRDKLSLVDVAMLGYQTPDGSLRSLPLQTAKLDREGNLWFFIHMDQPVVAAVARNPHINLVYVNDKEGIYISVAGEARVLRNRDLQETLWNGKLRRWFRQGPQSEDAALLKVAVEFCEYWDEPRSNLFRMLLKATEAAEGEEVAMSHRQIPVEPKGAKGDWSPRP